MVVVNAIVVMNDAAGQIVDERIHEFRIPYRCRRRSCLAPIRGSDVSDTVIRAQKDERDVRAIHSSFA